MGSLSPPKNDVSKLLDFTLKNNKLSSDKNEWIQKNLLQSQKNIGSSIDLIKMYFKFQNYKLVILRVLVLIVIIAISYFILKVYNIRPRAFTIWKYLNISSKFDKSTGLDIELADKLSDALANYISLPSLIIDEINYKSKFISNPEFVTKKLTTSKTSKKCKKNSVCSTKTNVTTNTTEQDTNEQYKVEYIDYLEEYLFENYNVDNKLYNLLRKFVEYCDEEYDSKALSDSEKLKNQTVNTNQKHMNKNVFNTTSKNLYLSEYFKIIENMLPVYNITIDNKLDNKVVNDFISNINKKPDIDWDGKIDKSYEKIKTFFSNILRTQSTNTQLSSNEKIIEVYKNIFYRNVLYIIINKNSTEINKQLSNLENSNILSYLNPNIYNSENDPGRDLFKNYGKYLYVKNNNDIQSFKDVINPSATIPDFIKSEIKNTETFVTKNELIKNIKNKIEEKLNKIQSGVSYMKYINNDFKYVFDTLKDYKSNKLGLNGYEEEYNNYKKELNKIRNHKYDTENYIVNEIYKLDVKDYKATKDKTIKSIYNIHNIPDSDKSIIHIFNCLIVFEDFLNFKNVITKQSGKYKKNNKKCPTSSSVCSSILPSTIKSNDNSVVQDDLYNELIKYQYYIEYFSTLTYFDNKKDKYVYLFDNDNDKLEFIKFFHEPLNLALYIKDIDIVNAATFSTMVLHDNNSQTSFNSLANLPKYYMSFIEIKLADNFINDVKNFKENRTHIDIFNDFIRVKWEDYWNNIIIKEYINKELSWDYQTKFSKPYWDSFSRKMNDECTWFTDPVIRSILGITNQCAKEERVEGFLGFLKALGRLPGMIINIPKHLGEILNTFIKLVNVVVQVARFIIRMIGNIDKLLIPNPLRMLTFIISIFLYMVAKILIILLSIQIGTLPIGQLLLLYVLTVTILFPLALLKISVVLILLIVITIVALICWILDWSISIFTNKQSVFTRMLYKVTSCENSPFSWYKNSRYDLDNKNTKGLLCYSPCGSNYRLSFENDACHKAPSNVPYYCPQPLLYRIYIKERTSGVKQVGTFNIRNYPYLIFSSASTQKEFIDNYKRNKKEYYDSCNRKNTENPEYNQIGKNICAYGYSNDGKPISNDIKNICKQTYCSNGKYEDFCYKYDKDVKYNIPTMPKSNSKKALLGIVTIFLVAYILYNFNLIEKNKYNPNKKSIFKFEIPNNLKQYYNKMSSVSS